MTSARRGELRLEKALATLPTVEGLRPLRAALVELSRGDDSLAWSSWADLATLDKRILDADRLEERIPALAEAARAREEKVMRHVVAALRALEDGDEAEAARRLVAAGEIEEVEDRLEAAAAYYEKASEIGRRSRDRSGHGLALRRLGRVLRTGGDFESAHRLYRESHGIALAEADESGAVVACLGAGTTLADQGRWEEAREWYLRGTDHVTDRGAPEFLHLCNVLSVAERRLGNLEESGRWLSTGEAEMDRVGDSAAAAHLEHGRARLHLARGEVAEAEAVFRRALTRELSPRARAVAIINLAEALLQAGRLQDAEGAIRTAEELAIRQGALEYLHHVYRVLGEIAGERGEPEGFVFFEQALDVVRDRSLPQVEEAAVQRQYGNFEFKVGNREAARARLRLARETFRQIGADAEAHQTERDLLAVSEETPDSSEDPHVEV